MTAGRNLICSIWTALGIALPQKRRTHMMQFLAGIPLGSIYYASLLRAMARAAIDARLVPVNRNAAHDPVELIAAAVAAAIARWDRQPLDGRALWADLTTRGVALEMLFQATTSQNALNALVRAVHEVTRTVGPAVIDLDAITRAPHALLAEHIVAGDCAGSDAACDALVVTAVPLAQGLLLARAAAYEDALTVFESILKRVPGHTVALQSAARCCRQLGDVARARVCERRAAIRLGPSRIAGDTAYSGSVASPKARNDQTTAAMWLRAPKRIQG